MSVYHDSIPLDKRVAVDVHLEFLDFEIFKGIFIRHKILIWPKSRFDWLGIKIPFHTHATTGNNKGEPEK